MTEAISLGVPVFCPHCNALFTSRCFPAADLKNWTIYNCRETCINCGQQANIASGVYSSTKGVLELMAGPRITRDLLEAFVELSEKLQNSKISADQFEVRAAKIDPQVGEAVTRLRQTSPFWALVIMLAVFAIKQCNFNFDASVKLDINQLWEQMHRSAIEQQIDQSHVDGNRQDAEQHQRPGQTSGPRKGAK